MEQYIKQRIADIRRGNVPAGYKRAKFGIIPNDWNWRIMGELTSHLTGQNGGSTDLPAYSINNQIGFIPQNLQFEDGSYDYLDKTSYRVVARGQFAYNPARINVGSIGVLKDRERVIVSSLYVCFSVGQDVDSSFLEYWFNTSNFYREIIRNTEGSVREYLFYENFANIRIALPPLAEQKRIAEILGCCDRGIALKKELIAEKRRQKKALMQKLLYPDSGFRLPGFTGEWKQVHIADVADLLTGYPFESEQFSSSGLKLLRCSNVKRGVLDWDPLITVYWQSAKGLEEFQLESGDIVIAMDGALAGYSFAKIACEDLPLLLVQRVARLRATKIHQDYLAHCVINPAFGEYITRVKTDTAIPHMSAKDILSYTFYMPASNEEQQAIANVLSAADREIDLLEQELAQQQQKKKSLMQLLLTGIARV